MAQEPRGPGPDPVGDFQRWLVRSGARSMTRELGGHIAGAFGLGGRSGDVWESATAPAPTEAPECEWCPVCRAARRLRVSGPGLASQVAAASDALATMVQDALGVVESALSAAGRRSGQGEPAGGPVPAWDQWAAADREAAQREAADRAAADEEAAAYWEGAADSEPAGEEEPGGQPTGAGQASAEDAGTVWAEATGAAPDGSEPAGPGPAAASSPE